MTFDQTKLSGFLDGELTPAETREVELALENDPSLQIELELLIANDRLLKNEFEAILSEPLPFELANTIQHAGSEFIVTKQNSSMIGWITGLAASIALAIGGVGGYLIGSNNIVETKTQIASVPGWLTDIADYHRIYSTQSRHLVEVPAAEAEHIEKWLTKSVGTDVRIPNLSKHGLKFEGARLLVAAAKPVAQLMFTDTNGKIVALCLIKNNKPPSDFKARTIGEFDMVNWNGNNTGFVIVADQGRGDLNNIANTAAQGI